MMNLQVKEEALSNEILTILDEDYEFQGKTKTLLDAISTIINPTNEIGLKYTNKLAELIKRDIAQSEEKAANVTDEDVASSSSLDFVFDQLFKNYFTEDDEGALDDFKAVFTKEELFNDVITLLSNGTETVAKTGNISQELFSKMDQIIEKSKS
jgi:hypothetical protein